MKLHQDSFAPLSAVELDLGAGLVTRMVRIAPPDTVDSSITRQGSPLESAGCPIVPTLITFAARDWLNSIPTDRPLGSWPMAGWVLTKDDFVSLLNRLISHFPSGRWPSTATPACRLGQQGRPRHQVLRGVCGSFPA